MFCTQTWMWYTGNNPRSDGGPFNHIWAAVVQFTTVNIDHIEIKRFMTPLGMSGAPLNNMDK